MLVFTFVIGVHVCGYFVVECGLTDRDVTSDGSRLGCDTIIPTIKRKKYIYTNKFTLVAVGYGVLQPVVVCSTPIISTNIKYRIVF